MSSSCVELHEQLVALRRTQQRLEEEISELWGSIAHYADHPQGDTSSRLDSEMESCQAELETIRREIVAVIQRQTDAGCT